MTTQIVDPKLTVEDVNLEIDFLSRLALGETIFSAAASMTVYSGTDPTPIAMVPDLPVVSGSVVSTLVTGGLPGVIYLLAVSIRTSLNNILVNEAKIAVLPSTAVTPP